MQQEQHIGAEQHIERSRVPTSRPIAGSLGHSMDGLFMMPLPRAIGFEVHTNMPISAHLTICVTFPLYIAVKSAAETYLRDVSFAGLPETHTMAGDKFVCG